MIFVHILLLSLFTACIPPSFWVGAMETPTHRTLRELNREQSMPQWHVKFNPSNTTAHMKTVVNIAVEIRGKLQIEF